MNGQVIWSPGVPLENLIQQAVVSAMSFYKGNKTAVANSLGIAIRTLDARLAKYEKEKTERDERFAKADERRRAFQDRQRAVPANAGFDSSATPSLHAAEAARRRAETLPRIANGTAGDVSGQGVQAQPAPTAAKK